MGGWGDAGRTAGGGMNLQAVGPGAASGRRPPPRGTHACAFLSEGRGTGTPGKVCAAAAARLPWAAVPYHPVCVPGTLQPAARARFQASTFPGCLGCRGLPPGSPGGEGRARLLRAAPGRSRRPLRALPAPSLLPPRLRWRPDRPQKRALRQTKNRMSLLPGAHFD